MESMKLRYETTKSGFHENPTWKKKQKHYVNWGVRPKMKFERNILLINSMFASRFCLFSNTYTQKIDLINISTKSLVLDITLVAIKIQRFGCYLFSVIRSIYTHTLSFSPMCAIYFLLWNQRNEAKKYVFFFFSLSLASVV